MSEYGERFERLAAAFTERVEAVPADRWESPAPCDGWVARDVVRHLVEWVPAFFESYAGLTIAPGPSVEDDPVGAWASASRPAVRVAGRSRCRVARRSTPHLVACPIEAAIDMFVTHDVLIHTWDLARATGLDERLDAAEVHRMYEGMLPMDEVLRQSGHFGPKVAVPDDADEQTKLLGFLGRQP